MSIDRKKRSNQADYKSIKEDGKAVPSPESFLSKIFTQIQLNPVEFIGMSRQEQNRVILDLIEFEWDLNWVKEQFGEIPPKVNYQQNILQVLAEIQSDDGYYYMTRQDINRDARTKNNMATEIAKSIPEGYEFDKWNEYNLGDKYRELEKNKEFNSKVQRAKVFKENYNNTIRGFQAEKEMAIASEEKAIGIERDGLKSTIEDLKAQIKVAEGKLSGLDDKLKNKKAVFEAEYQTKVVELEAKSESANKYLDKEPIDITELNDEINTAEAMKKHLNEYQRMRNMQIEVVSLNAQSDELTRKIELARELPSQILAVSKIPVEGLTVENGIPLVRGLPVSNLSDGEMLDLCVDVAISKPNALQIILIDGSERLSDENRTRLYAKCKEKGLQFIASRTTNDSELIVTQL